jgi:hypothetical protein
MISKFSLISLGLKLSNLNSFIFFLVLYHLHHWELYKQKHANITLTFDFINIGLFAKRVTLFISDMPIGNSGGVGVQVPSAW